MSTITTNFPTASVRRSHAARFTDGVVAGYIRELADASRVSAKPRAATLSAAVGVAAGVTSYATAPADLAGAAIEASQEQPSHEAGRPRKSPCWSRGGRVQHAMRAQRLLEAC
jgi:hypothetical protein